MDRLYLDIDWGSVSKDDWLVIDCFSQLNPDDYGRVWNDSFLKKYATALMKRQWGQNLLKFQGVKLPGGNRDWLRKIRPWYGHHYHFHVRLKCPNDAGECVNQHPPPLGDGCDEAEKWVKNILNPPKRDPNALVDTWTWSNKEALFCKPSSL